MPFYLANPKKSGSIQADGSRYTEYNRTKPSTMFFLATTAAALIFPIYFTGFYYLLAAILSSGIQDGNIRILTKGNRTTQVMVAVKDQCPIRLPYLEMKFRSAAINRENIRWLEERGATTVKIGVQGRNSDVFRLSLSHLSQDELIHLLAMRPQVDLKHRSTAEYIHFDSIRPVMRIREQLSAYLITSHHVFSNPEAFAYCGQGKNCTTTDWNTIRAFDEDGDAEMDGVIKDAKMFLPGDLYVGITKSELPAPAWGGMENRPEGPGIAVPFIKNYANPDTEGISWFVKEHFRSFGLYGEDVVETVGQIYAAWRTDIFLTSFGMEVAHILKVLELASSVGAPVFVLFSGDVMNGCFVGGKDVMFTRYDGATYEGVDNVASEWASLSVHDNALEEIRKVVGLPANWEVPMTMRKLRTLVFAGGEPSGVVKNRIQELLVDLTFPEAPDSINSTTVIDTLEYLTSEAFIPDTMYLDRRSFFSLRRDVQILARFGPKAPSFNAGSKLTRMCSLAKGPGISGAAVYSNAPPVPLQVVRKPTLAAASDWTSLINNGMATLEVGKELENGFTFRGTDRVQVWGALNGRIGAKIRDAMEVETSGGGNKRDLEEGEIDEVEGNVEIGKGMKKRRVI